MNALKWMRGHKTRPESPEVLIVDEQEFVGDREIAADGFPVVPRRFWHSTAATFDEWMDQGREHYWSMRNILSEAGFVPEGKRILDFGCSSGRTVRLWKDVPETEVWGCEVDFARLTWCRLNLCPPFRFVQTTEEPRLPFWDGHFDLVYAGSVFTHISDYVDTWLLEIRRIIKLGGMFFVTIHDENTWRLVRKGEGKALEAALNLPETRGHDELPYEFLSVGRHLDSQVFFRRAYFEKLVSPFFQIIAALPAARGYQTALVLKVL